MRAGTKAAVVSGAILNVQDFRVLDQLLVKPVSKETMVY